MAIIKVLNTAFTGAGASAPILTKVDKMESAGSLLLVDMSKQAYTVGSNQTFTNLFETQQKAITGASSVITYSQNIADATVSKIERTPKGGIHILNKEAVFVPFPNNYAKINTTGGVHDWIKNKWQNTPATDHQFFFSAWVQLTATNKSTWYPYNYSSDSSTGTERVVYANFSTNQPLGTKRISNPSSYGTTVPAPLTDFGLFNGGNAFLNSAGAGNRQYESAIFYRFYIEDLTISGRSYATVDALDLATFNDAFAVGGKFYGDTWTDPATLG